MKPSPRNPAALDPAGSQPFRLAMWLLAVGIAAQALGPLVTPARAQAAAGNLELCHQWAGSTGPERAALADELGRRNALTKTRKLAEPDPSTGRSVYATADIQRLCRRH